MDVPVDMLLEMQGAFACRCCRWGGLRACYESLACRTESVVTSFVERHIIVVGSYFGVVRRHGRVPPIYTSASCSPFSAVESKLLESCKWFALAECPGSSGAIPSGILYGTNARAL